MMHHSLVTMKDEPSILVRKNSSKYRIVMFLACWRSINKIREKYPMTVHVQKTGAHRQMAQTAIGILSVCM